VLNVAAHLAVKIFPTNACAPLPRRVKLEQKDGMQREAANFDGD